jgi:NAD(P)-dependent dehydrogenase (short-subunit alcohol dehydrogenase family)
MNILIFGASGSIGNHLYNKFKAGYNVYGSSSADNSVYPIKCKIVNGQLVHNMLELNLPKLDGIIWAQGKNINDSIYNLDINNFNSIIECNVTFILETLKVLLDNNLINDRAKMVIISSIWEDFTRDNKLSYSISKGCLTNLVKNIAFDLSKKHILINNVLPGPIDNEMTISTLSKEQIQSISEYTGFNRLVSLDDVYNTVKFLLVCNTGISGQSIKVDLGFTAIKKY